MLIATFGPTTAWGGRKISREEDVFILQDHGAITAVDIMEYDKKGQLVWAGAETRAWIGSRELIPAVQTLAVQAGGEASGHLELARQQFHEGKHKKALGTLWYVLPGAWTDAGEAQGLLELASAIRVTGEKRLQNECDDLIGRAQVAISRLAADNMRKGTVHLRLCQILGGSGLQPQAGEAWDLVFLETELELRGPHSELTTVPYTDILTLEIGGPGAHQSGGGFIGGGFGLEGAVTGMLVGAALNLLTTRTKISTVICLQTISAELYVHTDAITPDALRMSLSPVFTHLRQREIAGLPVHTSGDDSTGDIVEKLAKLSELHDTGKLTDEEFSAFKARLMG